MSPSNSESEWPYLNLDKGLDELEELAGDDPTLQPVVELVRIGRRLQSEGQFDQADASEIASILLRNRDARSALKFLDHVAQRGPRTMLHRAVVGEVERRSRLGCG